MATNGRSVLACVTSYGLMLILASAVLDRVPKVSLTDDPFSYIVVASKNIPGHGPHMSEVIAPAVSPGITTVVLIQNGINIERPYFERFPRNIVLSGVSYAGSQEVEHGVVSHGNHDDLFIGPFCNPNIEDSLEEAAAKHFVSLYAASGRASCQFTPDAQWYRWKKLVYNASMNTLCAITDLDTGSLRLAGSAMREIIEAAMAEVMAVASAAGHSLPKELPRALIDMDPVEDHYEPSMLQDVRKVRDPHYESVRQNTYGIRAT
jgi:2-dehydropantoate 2-reductase